MAEDLRRESRMSAIDDREVEKFYTRRNREPKPVYVCENCGEPIFEGQKYMEIPSDGTYCEECFKDWIYEA